MRLLQKLPFQVLACAGLGVVIGIAYRQHRADETAWAATHYELDESIPFPMARGIPFEEQYFVDPTGERIVLPLDDGEEIDLAGAVWWNVDGSGRTRLWNAERVEVFPTLVAR